MAQHLTVIENQPQPVQNVGFTLRDMERMALAFAQSGLFGVKTPDQALALCLIAQAEGRHPALAARDYDVINGRPAKKAEAMLRDFLGAGGKVEWHELSDQRADATFSHPLGGKVRIDWDMDRAKQAGLGGKDMWKKFPRNMLRSRVVSEGVRTVLPAATSGMYVPEEVSDFNEPAPQPALQVKPEPMPTPKPARQTPEQWAAEHIAAVQEANTSGALEAIIRKGQRALAKLVTEQPKLADEINTEYAARREALEPQDTDHGDQFPEADTENWEQ